MILSPDHFLIDADGIYDWSPAGVASAWAATIRRTQELLSDPRYISLVLLVGVSGSGKSTWLRSHMERNKVYIDATFTTKAGRAPFIEIARGADRVIDVVFLDTPFEECARRNALRSDDRRVPDAKMFRFRDQLRNEPPTLAEGFRQVVVVTP